MKRQATTTGADDWLMKFRAGVARLRGAAAREIYKADSISLALLKGEQRQLSMCWKTGRRRPG